MRESKEMFINRNNSKVSNSISVVEMVQLANHHMSHIDDVIICSVIVVIT